jgi:hypothetical protein
MRGVASQLETFCARRGFGIVVLMLTVALMVVLGYRAQELKNAVAPQGIVSLEVAGSAAEAASIIASWKDPAAAARQVYWDFAFILLYSLSLFNIGLSASRRAGVNNLPLLAAAARAAAWSGLLAGLFDMGENIGLLRELAGHATDRLAAWTSFCATTKFTLVATSFVVSISAGLAAPALPAGFTWQAMVHIARAPLGALMLMALGLLVPPQTRDMLAGLSAESSRELWSGFAFHLSLWILGTTAWYWSRAVLSAWFGVAGAAAARQAVAAANGATNPAAFDWVPRLLFLAVAGIGVIAAARSAAWRQLAVILLWAGPTIWVLYRRGQWAPAALPPAPWLNRLPVGDDIRRLLRHAPFGPGFALALLATAIVLFIAAAIGTFLPVAALRSGLSDFAGRLLPGPAAVFAFLGLVLGPLTALTYAADGIMLTGTLWRVVWALRPPVLLAVLAVILVVPSLIDLHAVRVVQSEPIPAGSRNNLDQLFKAWADTCQPGRTKLRPVIVAVSGGASRAGLWAARALAEIDAAASDGSAPIFAVSSVSGGSLGAAAYMAALTGQGGTACALRPANRAPFYESVVGAVGRDALGPALAGSLFGDVPRALAGLPVVAVRHALAAAFGGPYRDTRGGDRAEALERAFERNWSDALAERFAAWQPEQRSAAEFSRPFLALAYAGPPPPQTEPAARATPRGAPIWIANGTDAQNGERILTVPFNYEAWPFLGALDALTLLGRDVPVSTAVHNTARFALLSPAGELSPTRQDGKDSAPPAQLIDGGYFENEGLLTAWELAQYLKEHGSRILGTGHEVDPILVQATADADKDISEERIIRCSSSDAITPTAHDGPAHSLGKSRPLQAAVPLLGLYAVRGGHSDWILREVRRQYCVGTADARRFFHFYLYRLEADVPLNWVLSREMSCQIWRAMTDKVGDAENPNAKEAKDLTGALGLLAVSADPRQLCMRGR